MSAKQVSVFARLKSFIKRKASLQYKFDLQFYDKKWEGLKGIAEAGRYSIISGYIKYFTSGAHVLDLGCGEGILYERLSSTDFTHYVGVDFSRVAIDNATLLAKQNAQFVVGDLNDLHVGGRFDVIIYNESIYYLKDPLKAIEALRSQLNPGGIFIFSIVDKHGKEQTELWGKIGSILTLLDRTKVINAEGNSWTVQVYRG